MFWRWVVVVHDRLHDARDKAVTDKMVDDKFYTFHNDKDNWTYTSVVDSNREDD